MMDLTRVVGDTEDDPSVPSRGDRARNRRGRSRLGVGVPLGLAVTGAAVAVALSVGSSDPKAGRHGPPTGRDILLAAATALEHRPDLTTGRYWRVVETGRYTLDAKNGSGEGPIEVRMRAGIWLAGPGGGRSVAYRRCLSARPLTVQERADQGGLPSQGWPAYSTAARICAAGSGPAEKDAGLTAATDYRIADVAVSPIWLDNLSPDPAVLRRQIDAKLATAHQGGLAVYGHIVLPQLMTDLPIRPEIRAAVLRMMAGLPGVRASGKVMDALDRTGEGVVISGLGLGATELRWIIEPGTGRVLGVQEVVTGAGRRPAGSVVAERVYTSVGWTNEAPDPETSGLQ
ncbi:hypothetical protein GCM10023196_055000 [Actinoallomurus vinaceus]|uniref:CU044_5270 family protein n=1 Tax=Actinoallomurus vinaceus TaxID=1080074 RepID=A0ABP8UEW8_9ACTN